MSLSQQLQQVCRTLEEAGHLHTFRGQQSLDQLEEVAYLWQDTRSRRFFSQSIEPQTAQAAEVSELYRTLQGHAGTMASSVELAEAAAVLAALRIEEAQHAIGHCRQHLLLVEDLAMHAGAAAGNAEADMGRAEALMEGLG